MRTMIMILALLVAAASSAPPAVVDVDVNGLWTLSIETPRGTRSFDAQFVQDGEELTVFPKSDDRFTSEGHGTVKGDAVTWTWEQESQRRGKITITFTGTVSGDTMSGKAQMGGRGTSDWSAVRK